MVVVVVVAVVVVVVVVGDSTRLAPPLSLSTFHRKPLGPTPLCCRRGQQGGVAVCEYVHVYHESRCLRLLHQEWKESRRDGVVSFVWVVCIPFSSRPDKLRRRAQE